VLRHWAHDSKLEHCCLTTVLVVVLLAGCMPLETPVSSPQSSPSPAPPVSTPQPIAGVGFMTSPVLVEDVTFSTYVPVEANLPVTYSG